MTDRFKEAMYPALIVGFITNICVIALFVYVGVYDVLLSPILGALSFLLTFYLLISNRIGASLSFLVGAYTVVSEMCIHTHFLGWDGGFYYFIFLIPIIFLLNSNWKIWEMAAFNASLVIITSVLYFYYVEATPLYSLSDEHKELVQIFNLIGTALAVFIVMIYFSRIIIRKDEALIAANIELEIQNKEISEQHQHLQTLIKEVHHRVKNNLQIISSLMSLQHRLVEDKEVGEILIEAKRRVEAIALIHQKLYQDDKVNQVDFHSYLDEILGAQQMLTTDLKCELEADQVILHLDIAVPLGLIVSELITNSIKHAFSGISNPHLKVSLKKVSDAYQLEVTDNGIGLPDTFTLINPTSFGAEIIAALTEQISGEIEYTNDNGAQFKIIFQNSER